MKNCLEYSLSEIIFIARDSLVPEVDREEIIKQVNNLELFVAAFQSRNETQKFERDIKLIKERVIGMTRRQCTSLEEHELNDCILVLE